MPYSDEQLDEMLQRLSSDDRIFSDEVYIDQIKGIVKDLRSERQRADFLEKANREELDKYRAAVRKAKMLADLLEAVLDKTSGETFKKDPILRVAKMLCVNWHLMDEEPKDLWRS